MEEIGIVKKYTNWQNIKKQSCDAYKFYLESPSGEIEELRNIEYFYMGGSGEYVIVIAKNKYYIGYWYNDNIIYCFAECDSLKEACLSL